MTYVRKVRTASGAVAVQVARKMKGRHEILQKRHEELAGMPLVIAADAGMLSWTNLKALDEAGFSFIAGSRQTKAPGIWNRISIGKATILPISRSSTP